MLASRSDGGTKHITGYVYAIQRTHPLRLLTMCNRTLTFTYYEESDELVGVCADCRARAERESNAH